MDGVRLTGGDTMNFWIKGTPKEFAETLKARKRPADQ